jgi:hypothetical protein
MYIRGPSFALAEAIARQWRNIKEARPMPELFPIPLVEQIQCVEREIAYRTRVYPRQVFNHRMTRENADREIARMSAVLDTLIWLRDHHQ